MSKILCSRHNSDLSPVDQEACNLFDAFRQEIRLKNVRARLRPRRWNVKHVEFDGRLLERWFLKTTINVCLAGRSSLRWAASDTPLGEPPPLLVQAAFGQASLPEFIGLYTVGAVGNTIYSDDTVSFAPMIHGGTHVTGGAFGFRGYQFFMSLLTEKLPERITFVRLPSWHNASASFHLQHIRCEVGGFLSQKFTFRW